MPALLSTGGMFAVGVLSMGVLLGLAFMLGSLLSLSRWRHLREESADQFRATLAGPIEVAGTASPADDAGPFNAAVSGTPTLVSEIEVQVYESDDTGGGWHTRESRTTTRPFVVDSTAGQIRVEPAGATVLLDSETVDTLSSGEDATGRTAALFDAVGVERSVGSVDLGITSLDYGSRCRVRESRLDVGEDVYVAGRGVTNDPALGGFGGPDAVVRSQSSRSLRERLLGFPFVVGDSGENEVRRHFLRRGAIYGVVGVVFLLLAAGLLAAVLG